MFIAARLIQGCVLSVALLLAAAPVAAAGLEPTKPSQMVLLGPGASLCPTAGKIVNVRTQLDGVQLPFEIPPKQVLVITEVDWFIADAQASKAATIALTLQDPGAVIPAVGLFFDTAIADATGQAGHVAAVSNLIVRAGTTLCVTGSGPTQTVYIRGFLTKDK